MRLKTTNIPEKLSALRDREVNEEVLLREVKEILRKEEAKDSEILETLSKGKGTLTNSFDFDQLETGRIFHKEQIKKICIEYRLRFLDSRYFKGEIPVEALSRIKRLETQHDTSLKGFKIVAPSKLFKLEDKNDPLLFAPIGNDYFYLIHHWGNDLHPLRRLFVWPFKNIINLSLLVLLMSYLFTLMVPEGLFSKNNSTGEFWIIFFFMFKSVAAIVIFYGFALGKNFNHAIWNSKYFNA
ncbi:hypothetical protein [Poritiphilus flavus]|uniref:Uncharacterized protein n=1 Tax=Poritiphilus flavus TaxID=2697053 RepID=A0A6L9EFD4_9FLAO|nr:hypothetical protein [Poritiphilus flavus]NAS13426.1 hypothetical protein [Poritiphilus flavus]